MVGVGIAIKALPYRNASYCDSLGKNVSDLCFAWFFNLVDLMKTSKSRLAKRLLTRTLGRYLMPSPYRIQHMLAKKWPPGDSQHMKVSQRLPFRMSWEIVNKQVQSIQPASLVSQKTKYACGS